MLWVIKPLKLNINKEKVNWRTYKVLINKENKEVN